MGKKQAASEQPGGHLMMHLINGQETVCLKAYRIGKEWVHHYLIPLDPLPNGAEEMRMVYVDPDDLLTSCQGAFLLDLTDREGAEGAPPVGGALQNGKGTFLKVYDADSELRHFAYVNIQTGEIMRRQERGITAQQTWTCLAIGGDPRQGFVAKLKKSLGL